MVRRLRRGTPARNRRMITRRNRNTGSGGMFVPTMPVAKNRMGLVMDQLTTSRMYRISNISVTAASFAGAYSFQLDFLPQSGEFTALFDCYKIWKVDCTFVPKYNTSDFATGGAGFGFPCIYLAEDRTTGGAPASINELMQYNTCVSRRFDKPITYTCWPQIIQTAAGGSYFDDRQKDLWVRSEDPSVGYLGIKWGLDLPLGVEVFRMDVVFKYYLKFKDVK